MLPETEPLESQAKGHRTKAGSQVTARRGLAPDHTHTDIPGQARGLTAVDAGAPVSNVTEARTQGEGPAAWRGAYRPL